MVKKPGRHHLNQVKLKSSITRETGIMHLLMRCTEDTRSLLLHSAKNKTNHEQTTDKPKEGHTVKQLAHTLQKYQSHSRQKAESEASSD